MWRRPRSSTGYPGGLAITALLAVSAGSSACQDRNQGIAPPSGQLFFPSGLYVDDTVTVTITAPSGELREAGKYLFVANGNNDLSFNSGTLAAIDLERFWGRWYDPDTQTPFPYCEPAGPTGDGRCTEPPGGVVSQEFPCRRLALKPRVVECDEGPFIDDDLFIRVGDFATVLAASVESDRDGDFTRLWLPVRGDPSITYVDVRATGPASARRLVLDGDQLADPGGTGEPRCDQRLRYARNEADLQALGREPFNMLIVEPDAETGERLAFVAHSAGSQLTLIDLDGIGADGCPAIVDQVDLFVAGGFPTGSFGLAVRPCFAASPEDPEPNVPSLTNDCTRPLVYASYRQAPLLSSFTASGLQLPPQSNFVEPSLRTDCFVDVPLACRDEATGEFDLVGCTADPATCGGGGGSCERLYAGQYCATPEQIGQPCAVPCEPRVRADRQIRPGGLFPSQAGPILGDIEFADRRGDTLLVVQTGPGALLLVDTSLGADGEPVDQPASPPIEICAQPTRMVVYDDGGQRFALVSCFAAALVYVVDLEARRVVDTVRVGTGPHDLALDPAREVVYVANTLESSVSVIDLSRTRATRFQEMARIGLQEPFEQ